MGFYTRCSERLDVRVGLVESSDVELQCPLEKVLLKGLENWIQSNQVYLFSVQDGSSVFICFFLF